jgi:hypothetical protein
MTEIVLSHEVTERILVRLLVAAFSVGSWLNLLGSAIGQKPSVAARGALQMSLPHCTAFSSYCRSSGFL